MNIFKKLLFIIPFALYFGVVQAEAMTISIPGLTFVQQKADDGQLLTQKLMPLNDRYPVASVSDVFKDNILLTIAYMSGKVKSASDVNWDELHKPMSYTFELKPGQVFAFHDNVLPEFAGKELITTKAHFGADEGFKSDGLYFGDGVCHLASLMNWAARDAGLKVTAPTNHNFAKIADIAPEYGTAIYFSPGDTGVNEQQNLYVENTFDKPVKFVITSANNTVSVKIYK